MFIYTNREEVIE